MPYEKGLPQPKIFPMRSLRGEVVSCYQSGEGDQILIKKTCKDTGGLSIATDKIPLLHLKTITRYSLHYMALGI